MPAFPALLLIMVLAEREKKREKGRELVNALRQIDTPSSLCPARSYISDSTTYILTFFVRDATAVPAQ